MAQIIDIEERRKPRPTQRARVDLPRASSLFDPTLYVGQLVTPAAMVWRSWFASWGSLWLAPLGLQVSPVELPRPVEPKDLAGPRS